jgi:organic radical activating enzyme
MPKIVEDKIEFYITNVCNFNCDNCNRLNNYYFSGHDLWEDYAEIYSRWSEKIDFTKITILGGEPTLNPSMDQWIAGIRDLWPRAKMSVLTNGTRLDYWHRRGLFDLLAKTDTELNITLHNRSRYQSVVAEVKQYLTDPVENLISNNGIDWCKAYNNVKDPSWPECKSYEDFDLLPEHIKKECVEVHHIGYDDFVRNTGKLSLTDTNGIKVTVVYAEDFITAPLRYAGENRFAVYDSDPVKAHSACLSKYCSHFIKGKLFKCHHVGLLPEFSKQYQVDMTTQQKDLLMQYKPLTVDTDHDNMVQFLERMKDWIPQCQLCPSKLETVLLTSSTKKPKIKKKVIDITPLY